MYCSNCGKEVSPNAKFFQYCGKPVFYEKELPNQRMQQEPRMESNQRLQFEQSQTADRNERKTLLIGIILALLIIVALGAIGIIMNHRKTGVALAVEPEYYDVELPDIILYDKNNIRITAKGFVDAGEEISDYSGSGLYIEIQNNRSDPIMVLCATDGFLVNGYQLPFIGTTGNGWTEPGETTICKMTFENRYLDLLNITQVSYIHAKLKIRDTASSTGFDDTTEGTDIMIREEDINEPPEGDLIYNENGIRITYLDYKEGSNYYEAFFLVENATEKDITLSNYKHTKEGMCDLHSDQYFTAGTKGIMGVNLGDDEHGIEHNEVEYMEESCVIYEKETGEIMGGFDHYQISFR